MGPHLGSLPVEPLTGGRDTWVYEVTGSPTVASGGYAIAIDTADGVVVANTRRYQW